MQLKIPYMSKILQFYDASGEKKAVAKYLTVACLPFYFLLYFFRVSVGVILFFSR